LEIINISIDKTKVKGARGFLIKIIDRDEKLKEYEKKNNYWPYKELKIASSPFVSVHKKLGFQPWFSKKRREYDTDASPNSCYNVLPNAICGDSTNKFVNIERQEIIDRGVS